MSKGIVVIPTYNEIENIEAIINAVFALKTEFHVLIVDDNSPDGTSLKVEELQQQFSDKLFLEVRHKKSGLGTAYVHGFKWALEREYEYVFEMDADFSHNPKDL
ncbi:MAG: glycosyltransferase, partial [Flavobacterium sp.]